MGPPCMLTMSVTCGAEQTPDSVRPTTLGSRARCHWQSHPRLASSASHVPTKQSAHVCVDPGRSHAPVCTAWTGSKHGARHPARCHRLLSASAWLPRDCVAHFSGSKLLLHFLEPKRRLKRSCLESVRAVAGQVRELRQLRVPVGPGHFAELMRPRCRSRERPKEQKVAAPVARSVSTSVLPKLRRSATQTSLNDRETHFVQEPHRVVRNSGTNECS